MGNEAKGDPILRIVLVVFAGLLVFGFLFGSSFGATAQGGGHHGAASGGGFYFGGLVTGLISFLINVLLLVLVFALIAGLLMGVRKLLDSCKKDSAFQNCQIANAVNQDPVLKGLLMAVAGIFAIYIIAGVFRSLEFGGGYGFSPYSMLFVLLAVLLKILMLALVITLTIALVQYLKTQFFDSQQAENSSSSTALIPQLSASSTTDNHSTNPVIPSNGNGKHTVDREKK